MRRSELLQGIREMRFISVYKRFSGGEITQQVAADLLGISDRTFRRWAERFGDEGSAGLTDRRRGNAAHNRAPEAEADSVEVLYRQRYAGFTAKHFHEHLVTQHGFRWSYTWTKSLLQRRGLLSRAPRRGAHRRRRPRRPLPGMMLHQDASRHAWLGEAAPACDLVVTLDDATSAIYSALLVAEEGTASTFAGLLETFAAQGLPCSLYTDRGSHYFVTLKAGGRVSRGESTQVGRALRQLGVEHIAAYSPEARGRSERAFRTLQDRLPKELALAGITTVDAANAWLRESYIAAHNARFAVAAEQPGSAFVAVAGVDLREVLCHEEERQVGPDNTVVLHKLRLQIPPSPLRAHYVRATVRVRRYADGRHAIFHGPRCIGRYDADGRLEGPPGGGGHQPSGLTARRVPPLDAPLPSRG